MPTSPTTPDRPAEELAATIETALRDSLPVWWQTPPRLDWAALAVARQLLGTAEGAGAAAALEPQDHPGADLFVALRAAGLDVDEANRRIHAYAGMVLRQEKALAAPPAPADRAAVLLWAAEAVDNTEFPDEYVDLFDNGARWASRLLRRLAGEAAAGVQQTTEGEARRPGRCPVMIPGVGRCEQNADHQAPHTPEPTVPAVPADGTRCTCGGRFPTFHLHADTHEPTPAAPAVPEERP